MNILSDAILELIGQAFGGPQRTRSYLLLRTGIGFLAASIAALPLISHRSNAAGYWNFKVAVSALLLASAGVLISLLQLLKYGADAKLALACLAVNASASIALSAWLQY